MFILPTSPPVEIEGFTNISPPKLPSHLEDLSQAKRLFIEICRWRYRLSARSYASMLDSQAFQETRSFFVRLYLLLKTYKDDVTHQPGPRRREIVTFLTEYRLLYLAIVYSARAEL